MMLERLRTLMHPVEAVLALNTNTNSRVTPLSGFQKRVLHEVEKLLAPLAVVQEQLEGDEYPTASLVPYCLYKIHDALSKNERAGNYLRDPENGKTYSLCHLARIMQTDFELKRYGDLS